MSATTMTVSTAPAGFGRFARHVGTAALRLAEFVRAYKNRRDLESLAGFDDRMLADIGLTRGDVRDATAEPLWRDPTHILVMRSRERRLSRRVSAQRDNGIVTAPSLVPDPAQSTGSDSQAPARYY